MQILISSSVCFLCLNCFAVKELHSVTCIYIRSILAWDRRAVAVTSAQVAIYIVKTSLE